MISETMAVKFNYYRNKMKSLQRQINNSFYSVLPSIFPQSWN